MKNLIKVVKLQQKAIKELSERIADLEKLEKKASVKLAQVAEKSTSDLIVEILGMNQVQTDGVLVFVSGGVASIECPSASCLASIKEKKDAIKANILSNKNLAGLSKVIASIKGDDKEFFVVLSK